MTQVDQPPTEASFAGQARDEAERAVRRGDDLGALADQVSAEARRRLDAIRDDTRLSGEAKVSDTARVRAERNARMRALGEAHEAALRGELERLQRQMCSPPAGLTGAERIATDASFRDALQHAHQTEQRDATRQQLMDLWHSARLTGDSLQERATMVIGLERDDRDVLAAWIETHPEDAEPMQHLHEVHNRVHDRREQFGRAMRFRAAI